MAAGWGTTAPLYELGQWYPRMAVYDDVRGWNHEPYIGAGEFYLEYGRLRRGHYRTCGVCGRRHRPAAESTGGAHGWPSASGSAAAIASDTAIAIITADEAGDARRSRPATTGTLTWRFRPTACATSPSPRRPTSAGTPAVGREFTSTPSIVPPRPCGPRPITSSARGCEYYSEQWYPYPYAHMSSIEGPDRRHGVSHDDLRSCRPGSNRSPVDPGPRAGAPVGADGGRLERAALSLDGRGLQHLHRPGQRRQLLHAAPPTATRSRSIRCISIRGHAIPGQEQPLITDPIESRDLFWTGYQKPALMMQLLRYEVLGKRAFRSGVPQLSQGVGLQASRAGRFLPCHAGRVRNGPRLVLARRGSTAPLDSTRRWTQRGYRPMAGTDVYLSNRGDMVMPTELKLYYSDGQREVVRLPVEMWNLGPRFTYRAPVRPPCRQGRS